MQSHNRRVAGLTATLCHCLGFDHSASQALIFAAYMHDIGKAAVPQKLLNKAARLSPDEVELVRMHTVIGAQVLHAEGHTQAALVALHHHEAWDGTGYPYGLKHEEIPFPARIVGLCDVYAALREDRPYRPGLSHEASMRLITRGDVTGRTRPSMFDPELLSIFARNDTRFRVAAEAVLRPPHLVTATKCHL